MYKYILTNIAVQDLTSIWNYSYDTWSESQADTYYQMLIEKCDEIAINPSIGKNYEGVVRKLFGYKIGRHIIFYKIVNEREVLIIRVLHEKMDLKNRIKD